MTGSPFFVWVTNVSRDISKYSPSMSHKGSSRRRYGPLTHSFVQLVTSQSHFPVSMATTQGHFPVQTVTSQGHFPVSMATSQGHFPVQMATSEGHFPVQVATSQGHFPAQTATSQGHFPCPTRKYHEQKLKRHPDFKGFYFSSLIPLIQN